MCETPKKDLKHTQVLGRSPATTSRKRATLLHQPANEARPAVTSTGGFVSRAARTTKSACGPARAPPSALQPSPLGLSSPSLLPDASPAWDGHPSELGRRSVPHPLRVAVGYVQRRKVRHSAADPWHGHRGGGVPGAFSQKRKARSLICLSPHVRKAESGCGLRYFFRKCVLCAWR